MRTDNERFTRHDVRLFVAVLQSLKSSAAAKYHTAIENKVRMGNGRQALRILDVSMALHGERLSLQAAQELHTLHCNDIGGLEEALSKFEMLRARIPSVDGVQAFEHLRRMIKGLPQV